LELEWEEELAVAECALTLAATFLRNEESEPGQSE
jgi:hypothetical protein